MTTARFLFLLTAASFGLSLGTAEAQYSLRDSNGHHLLLHRGRIASMENVELVVGKPEKHAGNPIMVEEHPWEVRYGNLYPNVVFDPFEKFYKGWFSAFIVCESTAQTPESKRSELTYRGDHAGVARESGVLYGTSHNGELWNKPLLNLNPWEGEGDTNILLRGAEGAGVLRDSRSSRQLYKMVCRVNGKLVSRASADGIRWSSSGMGAGDLGVANAANAHHFPFWATERREYVVLTQLREGDGKGAVRMIGRASSKDFEEWTAVEPVLRGLTPEQQIVSMSVLPTGGVYLGFPVIHDVKEDRAHTELAWSADTIKWERLAPGTAFIENGSVGSHDWGSAYTGSVIAMNDGVRIFYGGSDGKLSGWRKGSLNLARLGTDRFAGYSSTANATATLNLKPLPYNGGTIAITADIGGGGYVMVSAEDNDGNNVVPSTRIEKGGTDIVVAAEVPKPMKELALRIRFENATVYSVVLR